MKWTLKLVRVGGIDIYVHVTFLILLVWLGLSYWQIEHSIAAVFNGLGFILALFACVVLHEFGHALMARKFGIGTKHITLLPIGGVAALEKMPEDPKQEIAVAIAGPAVNIAIAIVLWFFLAVSTSLVPANELNLSESSFLERLFIINIILAVFNLLPAFPMDGGRVLRAMLALRMNRHIATQVAAKIGQALAMLFVFVGLFYNPFLILIGIFVWFGAAAEAGAEQVQFTLADIRLEKAMLTDFKTLTQDEKLSQAIALTLSGSQKDFPVLKDNKMIGVLSQVALLKGLQSQGEQGLVKDWMERNAHTAEIHEPLSKVLARMQNEECRLLSVVKADQMVGIVNLDNVSELIRIQESLHGMNVR